MAQASSYYGYPAPVAPTRSLFGLGLATQLLLGVQLAVVLALVLPVLHVNDLVHRAQDNPGSVSLDAARHADNTVSALANLQLILYAATLIVWIFWFYRARVNAETWAPEMQRHGKGWAIGGWFCPIVQLWFPFTIAQDILNGTERKAEDRIYYGSPRPLLIAWWLTLIASFIIGRIANSSGDPETLDEITSYVHLTIAQIIATTVAAVLAVFVVRQITNAQQTRIGGASG